ncbi:MAG TPA: amino acid permease [Rudaea sp.]|jgi:APA family basic amino acid/polyamine antiporter|uniref:amino acid permease n=1 Tax=Rudaea sp. TaxID=2136325 RepID=UPI002F92EAB3
MNTAQRALGFWSATALVVGNMIGSGIFLLPASLAPFGMASLLGWSVSAVGALLLALVFAHMGRRYPVSGGPYAYARIAFGDFTGFVMAWSYWVSVWCAVAAIAVAFAGSMASLFPNLLASPERSAICALAVLWLCTLCNIAGVRAAGLAQLVTTILKVLPIVVIIALGAGSVDTHAFTPFNPSGGNLFSVTTTTAALALWALLGMECATIPAEHVVDAERVIPRATVAGTLFATLITVAACTIVLGLLPLDALKDSPAPFADVARELWGNGAAAAMAAAMAVSCLGALNGWILVQGQIPFAAARDGLFPAYFARVDARGTPRIGLVIGSALATILVAANFAGSLVSIFTASILLATAAALLPYVFSAAAMLRLEPREPDYAHWRMLVAALALIYGVWALIGTGSEALLWGCGLLLAGLPFYLLQRWRPQKKLSPSA